MIEAFAAADAVFKRADISDWLKKEEDEMYNELTDKQLAIFLNGLINIKRGKKDGFEFPPEEKLNNNLVIKKLKIALSLSSEDLLKIFFLADKIISEHALSAFFCNPNHRKYKTLNDQYLRNFLDGLQQRLRGQ